MEVSRQGRVRDPFAADADFVDIRGDLHKGKGNISEGHQQVFDTINACSTIRSEVLQARELDDQVILAHAKGSLSAPGGRRARGAGHRGAGPQRRPLGHRLLPQHADRQMARRRWRRPLSPPAGKTRTACGRLWTSGWWYRCPRRSLPGPGCAIRPSSSDRAGAKSRRRTRPVSSSSRWRPPRKPRSAVC